MTSPDSDVAGRRRHLLITLGCLELMLLVALAVWGREAFPGAGLALFGAAFVTYVAAAGIAGRGADQRHVWMFAIVMRVLLLPLMPELSDDVYRYLWDGHVQISGTNPYLHAPVDETLATLRTPYHPLINNPTVPTIYPPLAQVAFFLIAVAGGSLIAAKLLWLGFDLATAVVIGKIARLTGRDPGLALLLYLWSPLLIVEVAWSGHLETLGLFGLTVAILSVRKPFGAGVALAASALTKFAPAAALPAIARRHGWKAVAAFGVTFVLLYLPYASAGTALFTGLTTYGEHWWFMKGPFVVLEAAFSDPLTARRAAAAVVVLVVAWVTFKRYDTERALLWILGSGMIVTPTLHPWYVLWTLPMAALRASRPWILLSGLAFLGYYGLAAYHESGDWVQPAAVRAALWLPFLLALAYDGVRLVSESKPGVSAQEEDDEG